MTDKKPFKRRHKILIVEDEGIIALSLKEILHEWGYDVCGIAASGEEALKLAEKEAPDLAFLDIKLAGKMDGIETADRLYRSFGIPAIFMSGYLDKGTRTIIEGLKSAEIIPKPMDFDELRRKLDNLLKTP